MKTCTSCKTAKPFTEYYSNKRSKDGYQYQCKSCVGKRSKSYLSTEQGIATRQAWVENTKERRKWRRIRDRYGLSYDDYSNLIKIQNNRCALCKDLTEDFHIDHDHSCCAVNSTRKTCGKCVRGLLCGPCNKGLGHFTDDIEKLEKAITYLKGQK